MNYFYKDQYVLNKTFNRLTILDIFYKKNKRNHNVRYAKCKCSCGNEKDILLAEVVTGGTKSCGCYEKECSRNSPTKFKPNFDDNEIIGKTFNRLTVISNFYKDGIRYCKCKCSCGNEKILRYCNLVFSRVKSCGCIAKERSEHHKLTCELRRKYHDIKKRCYNEKCNNYKYYGGRGIKICDKWLGKNGSENFINWSLNNGWKSGLTIDRIDVNGDYSPNNCRWVNYHIQNTNKRIYKNNKTGYAGVINSSDGRGYESKIGLHNKIIELGYFKSKRLALEARNRFIIENGLTEYKIQEWKGE